MFGVPILRKIAQRKVINLLASQDLRERSSSDRRLDCILNICHVDLISRCRLAIDDIIQIRLPGNIQNSQIRDAPHMTHNGGDLVRLVLQHMQIAAINFGRQLAFHSADSLLHVVFNRLRKTPDHARESVFSSSLIHGRDQVVFILVEHGTPLFFRFQPHKIFRIEKSRVIGPVIGTARLTGALGDFWK